MPLSTSLYYHQYPGSESRDENLSSLTPVILIHGAGGTGLFWPPEVRRLPGFRIYSVDLPGHGKSDFSGGQQSIPAYTDQVREWMQSIGLHRAVFVGHSMGGAIALNMALQYADQVLGLGLISTGARLSVNPDLLENAASAPTFYKAVEAIVAWSYSPQAPARLSALALQRFAEVRPSVLYGDLLACDGFDVTDQLQWIRCPTLVVCGSEDRMTPPRFSQHLADNIAGAELVLIPGAGHMVMLEQPQAVAAALAGFLPKISF